MGLKNCASCNALFVSVAGDVCPACLDAEDQALEKVESFLRTSPKASLDEAAEATGVDTAVLMKLIRSKKLSIAGEGELFCEACGKSIKSGRMCLECQSKLTQIMSDSSGFKKAAPRIDDEESRRGGRSTIILDKFQRK